MTDHFTDDLFGQALPDAARIIFPVSRLVVDAERFVVDTEEPMAARGQGVIYLKTSGGDRLRDPLRNNLRDELLDRYYRPHHRKLGDAVQGALDKYGRALIVDAHSFPDTPLAVDLDQRPNRPDICIGTDVFHTPDELVRVASNFCADQGWSCEVNRPYAGTIVPVGCELVLKPRLAADISRGNVFPSDSC